MVDFIVSNVFSIVAACAKAYNNYLSKAIYFPIDHHLESTTPALHWASGTSLLLDTSLGGEFTGSYISSFCLESRTGLSGKIQTGLLDYPGLLEKSWSQAVKKKDQLPCCL